MPVFLDGQQNLAALTVPGVYGDIILPTAFIAGTPTNIEGLVGVASWGPLNALIPVSKPVDAAIQIGPPIARTYDMSSYVSAASQVGGAIGFFCVRVSDGTDVAATANVQSPGLTLTAKYSGVLGNQIQFSIQSGSKVNTLMGVVSFPGLVPEQFNNVVGPTPATASAIFSVNPTAAQTLVIAGSSISFVASGATGLQVNIGTNLAATLANLMTLLNTTQDVGLLKVNYALTGTTLLMAANQFSGVAQAGTGGNALTLTSTTTATLSGATFAGGVGTWQTFWTNMALAINNGQAGVRSASQFVVASSGTQTAVPILSTPATLTGGTDGASGVTDASLVGQDVVPRKGMYVLRQSNCDCFTLCDLSTLSQYAAIASFGLSETMYAIFGGPSGETIASALNVRANAGADTPWFKYVMGDWPDFYDSFNGQTRSINPSAFAIGMYGNLSPQASGLNKPLLGISATQRTKLGQPYSDAELQLINQGGIDVIVGPQTSPGGNYFSLGTARNASSNTAASGDEYTRMTNFLIRAAQSKAAGAFVGQLQSIQPNDQTRTKAKGVFDGFSAQLASSEVGLGVGGQGIIDKPWSVVCDLTNNTPDLQARGFLFLYWTVRYLNVIRYFVVKFQGGGNITVTVQNQAPTPAQFQQATNTVV